MPAVNMPDGVVVNLPDNPTPEEAVAIKQMFELSSKRAAAKNLPPIQPIAQVLKGVTIPTGDAPSPVMDKALSTGAEALRVADTIGRDAVFGPLHLIKAGGELLDKHTDTRKNLENALPSTLKDSPLAKAINAVAPMLSSLGKAITEPVERPQTRVGQEVANIGSSTLGAITNPVGWADKGRAALTGLGAGLGSTTAGLVDDSPVTRIVGALLGGGGAAAVLRDPTNRAQLSRQLLKGVDETELEMAKNALATAQANKAPITLSQAMTTPSNLDKMEEALAQSRFGDNVVSTLRQQPAIVESQARDLIGQIPGQINSPMVMDRKLLSAADGVIKALMTKRGEQWTEVRGNLLPVVKQELQNKADMASTKANAEWAKTLAGGGFSPNLFKAFKEAEDAAAFARGNGLAVPKKDLQGAIAELRLARHKAGPVATAEILSDPINRLRQIRSTSDGLYPIEQINNVFKDTRNRLDSPDLKTSGVSRHTISEVSDALEKAGVRLGTPYTPIKEANEAYKAYTAAIIAPVQEGPIGKIAGKGVVEGAVAPMDKFYKIIERGTPDGATSSDITTMAQLFKQNKQGDVYVEGVKNFLNKKLSESMKVEGGRLNDDIGKTLFSKLFETETQKNGIREALKGVGDILYPNQPAQQNAIVDGMQNFFTYLGQAARRPKSVTGMTSTDIEQTAKQSVIGNIGQVSVVTPLRQPIIKYVDWLLSDSYKAMDKLWTTPEGLATLQKWAAGPGASPALIASTATLLGATNSANQSFQRMKEKSEGKNFD